METPKPATIDEYIAGFPSKVQVILEQVRATVRDAAPQAAEAIKYGMPTFVLHGNVISFGAYKKHIGMYPVPKGDEALNAELAPYRREKSTLQFSLDEPMPLDLISRVVKLRAAELSEKSHKTK